MIAILTCFLLSVFSFFTVLPLLLSILSKMRQSRKMADGKGRTSFACIITAYKDIECARNLVYTLINQESYTNYHVYLVADDCETSSFDVVNDRFTLLKPDTLLHSKVKSIQYAIDFFGTKHSHLVVFDPDNLAHPQFLKELDNLHAQGFEVVQGRRVAKNLDTRYACLDAFSEYYYNFTQRAVPFSLGSSATIAGSGMSVLVTLYQEFIDVDIKNEGEKIIIAEDKMMQAYIVRNGHRMAFAGDAIVYDEKVTSAKQVKRQRTRWITSYFQYVAVSSKMLLTGLLKASWNQTLFAYTILLPPMFIIGLFWIGISAVLPFISMSQFFSLQACMFAFVANVFLALYWGGAPSKVISSVFFAPIFVLNQVKAMFSMKDTKTSFLTTEKTKNMSLEEVLQSKTNNQ